VVRSFKFAAAGVAHSFSERNMQVHLLATVVVVVLGIVLKLSFIEWMLVLLCIGFVLSSELVNTAVEQMCDGLVKSKALDYKDAGLPKDLAAGSVLVAAVTSGVVGLAIFLWHVKILMGA